LSQTPKSKSLRISIPRDLWLLQDFRKEPANEVSVHENP